MRLVTSNLRIITKKPLEISRGLSGHVGILISPTEHIDFIDVFSI